MKRKMVFQDPPNVRFGSTLIGGRVGGKTTDTEETCNQQIEAWKLNKRVSSWFFVRHLIYKISKWNLGKEATPANIRFPNFASMAIWFIVVRVKKRRDGAPGFHCCSLCDQRTPCDPSFGTCLGQTAPSDIRHHITVPVPNHEYTGSLPVEADKLSTMRTRMNSSYGNSWLPWKLPKV